MIEREKKQIDKIKKRQYQEVQHIQEYELKMEEIKRRNNEKMNLFHKREKQRKKEIEQQHKEQEV